MPRHPWLEELRGNLACRGLPRSYIARFVAELEDHLQDISLEQEVSVSTDMRKAPDDRVWVERLGSQEQLVEHAVANYQGASFAGRHPVMVFLLAPIPAALICWAVFLLVAVLGVEGLGYVLGPGVLPPASDWPVAVVRCESPLLRAPIPTVGREPIKQKAFLTQGGARCASWPWANLPRRLRREIPLRRLLLIGPCTSVSWFVSPASPLVQTGPPGEMNAHRNQFRTAGAPQVSPGPASAARAALGMRPNGDWHAEGVRLEGGRLKVP